MYLCKQMVFLQTGIIDWDSKKDVLMESYSVVGVHTQG